MKRIKFYLPKEFIMKTFSILIFINTIGLSSLQAQNSKLGDKQKKDLYTLIDNYSEARENRDTILLKSIFTSDIDQLVSTGEWRAGIASSVKGMLTSSAGNPGTRTLTVEKIKVLDKNTSIIDCKYEIQNPNGTTRKMWSTFIAVSEKGVWRISAIRNMLPSGK